VEDQSRKEITGLARLAGDLGRRAAGRSDPINEAYLQGIAEGLGLAELLICNEVQFMTRWGQILAAQQLQPPCLDPAVRAPRGAACGVHAIPH
jgi:hypothetical protein